MSLEGFNINVWFALPFGGFYSPDNSNAALVFGVGNCCRDSVALVKPCMGAMALLAWIKVCGSQSSRDKVVLIEVGFNGSIDDRVDASSSCGRACTSCANILEPNMLVKGSREFVACPLLCE